MADIGATADALLARITRCPVAKRCRDGEHLPCSTIVRSQPATPRGFHAPEPWSGHIPACPRVTLGVPGGPSVRARHCLVRQASVAAVLVVSVAAGHPRPAHAPAFWPAVRGPVGAPQEVNPAPRGGAGVVDRLGRPYDEAADKGRH